MSTRARWLLPEGVEEILPPRAARIEALRRRLLDLFACWGYELVLPPLIEYLDSLLTGLGEDLDLQTVKVVDQQSGRMLGIRADMTSQAARFGARGVAGDGDVRLCYAGTVLHAAPASAFASRTPLLAGAELFGDSGRAGDAEVITLMHAALAAAGQQDVVVELGHVGVFRALAAAASLDAQQERELFAAVQRKSRHGVQAVVEPLRLDADLLAALQALPDLMGDADVLGKARALLRGQAAAATAAALADLEDVAARVRARVPEVRLRFDLAELRGYGYHNGVVFAAYRSGYSRALSRGGRYDQVGAAFGRGRGATGFDVDLRALADLAAGHDPARQAIFAPCADGLGVAQQAAREQAVVALRAAGEVVIEGLRPGAAPPAACGRTLGPDKDAWRVEPIPLQDEERGNG